MKSIGLGLVLWLSAGVIDTFAQTPNLPPPKNPVLHRTEAYASWTVQFDYKTGEKSGDPARQSPSLRANDQVQASTVSKTGKTYREQTTFKSGKKEEKWILDGVQLLMLQGSGVIVPVSAPSSDSPDPNYSDYSRSDFAGLGWVSLDTYKGIQSYEGKPAYVFELPKPDGGMTALLSVENQLPLYFTDGHTTRVYSYHPAPTEPLTPPANFLDVLATYNKGVGSLTRRPRTSPP